MEKYSLLKSDALDHARIDYGAYTLSLLQEARRVGMLTEADAGTLEAGLLALLRVQIEKSTHGESSSVPAETADELMDGVGYCIDLALENQPTHADAITLLKNQPVEAIYQLGVQFLRARAKHCDALLSRVRATRVKTVNAAYGITLDQSLPAMLRSWKSSPFPHDFLVLTEYPLAREDTATGLLELHDRLASLALENRFCGRFSDELEELLRCYAHANAVTPADAYVNLFTLALRNRLLNLLCGRAGLLLDSASADTLAQKLIALSDAPRHALIVHAADRLLAECAFESEPLETYVRQAAADFADVLVRTGGRLDALAVVGAPESGTLLVDGERLGDEAFALLADELLLCDTVQEKAELLLTELHALDDLCDMLNADLLFDEEYRAVYERFTPEVLTLLLTRVDPEFIDGRIYPREEIEWQLKLARFVNDGADGHQPQILALYHTLAG